MSVCVPAVYIPISIFELDLYLCNNQNVQYFTQTKTVTRFSQSIEIYTKMKLSSKIPNRRKIISGEERFSSKLIHLIYIQIVDAKRFCFSQI